MTSSFAAAQPVIIDDVRQAAARLASRARRTPVFTVRIDGRPVTLKLEFMQVTGAFKFRGALNAIAAAQWSRRRDVTLVACRLSAGHNLNLTKVR